MKPHNSQLILRLLRMPIVICLVILLPAGTFNFWQVYVYFGVVILFACCAHVYLSTYNPELLARRLQEKEKEAVQKIAILIISTAMLFTYLLAGFDKRFGWSEVSMGSQLAGFFLILVAYYLIFRVLKINSFAARTIEIQDRQKVVDSGPYALVRHPMYSGFMVFYLGTPLALASWWAMAPIFLMLVGFSIRISNEEAVLRAQLDGYLAYCQRTRWRLLPGVW